MTIGLPPSSAYREAVPNAGFTEASQYVAHLREFLRVQHPGKNDPAPLSLAELLKEMLIGTMWPAFLSGLHLLVLHEADISPDLDRFPSVPVSLLDWHGSNGRLRAA